MDRVVLVGLLDVRAQGRARQGGPAAGAGRGENQQLRDGDETFTAQRLRYPQAPWARGGEARARRGALACRAATETQEPRRAGGTGRERGREGLGTEAGQAGGEDGLAANAPGPHPLPPSEVIAHHTGAAGPKPRAGQRQLGKT